MKLFLIIILFSAFASLGQTPSVTPTESRSPKNPKTRISGSSIEKPESKKRLNSQDNRKIEESDDETISVKTVLVVNDVLVTDQSGKAIADLKKEDFVITENGVPQAIEVFSLGENATVPRSIVLVVDCGAPQAPYLKTSIEAAKMLVDKLNPQDKMAIVTVDVKLRTNFTQDRTLLKNALDSLEKKDINLAGGSEFDALLTVLNAMFDKKDRHRIVIFQGDGSQVIWLKTDKDTPYPVSDTTLELSGLKWIREKEKKKMWRFGFTNIKEAIERSQATIYSVATGIRFLGLPEKERLARGSISVENVGRAFGWKVSSTIKRMYQERNAEIYTAGQTAMSKVAELSGGSMNFIEKPEDAENVYANIFTNIKNRYVIGYYPTNQEQGEKRRNVKFEVRGHPEYIITGRKTYFLR
jgi:VWFA-related protein